jgi:hypothetical protein
MVSHLIDDCPTSQHDFFSLPCQIQQIPLANTLYKGLDNTPTNYRGGRPLNNRKTELDAHNFFYAISSLPIFFLFSAQSLQYVMKIM